MSERGGSLVVVGSGIQWGRHIGRRAESELRAADRVFAMVDAFAFDRIAALRPDVVDLGRHYHGMPDRTATYRAMERELVDAVRSGEAVCAVFYGHPGVFADVPHGAIAAVRELGLPARMEPGISAEACLYADLGLDPGARGVQSFEATQFLIEKRQIDPGALLILWQIALVGDLALNRFHADPGALALLVEKLGRWYPADTEAVLYEAAQLPVQPHRADRMPLEDLADARYLEYTTLVIPPRGRAEADSEWIDRLRERRSAPNG